MLNLEVHVYKKLSGIFLNFVSIESDIRIYCHLIRENVEIRLIYGTGTQRIKL